MAAVNVLDWNEVLVVRKEQNEVSCWTAWRRDISAFADPALWTTPSAWDTYFKRQPPDAGWGFSGYGLIVMDMDARKVYSLNDYMAAGSVELPMDSVVYNNPEHTYRSLRQLLATPSAWPDVTMRAFKETVLRRAEKPTTLTLADVLPAGVDAATAFDLVEIKRGTLRDAQGRKWLVASTDYSPPDWQVLTDRGQEEPTFTLQVLTELMHAGFPPPDWDNIKERVLGDDLEFDDALDDESDDAYQAAEVRLSALREQWTERAVTLSNGLSF